MTGERTLPRPVLRAWVTPPEVSTAGSIYAVAPDLHLPAARLLHEHGRWVHFDVVTEAGRPAGGVPLETLAAVRAALPDARLEVHVICRDAGPAPLDAVLDQVLAAQPGRVVLPLQACDATTPLPRRVRAQGAQVWAEVAPDARIGDPHALRAGADGALVMLIEPGTRQDADLARLETVRMLAPHMQVGVDGGVGPDNTADCLEAGAVHLVSGRALLCPEEPTHDVVEGVR
jgi:pentose-5-phosphate-3-epimerase